MGGKNSKDGHWQKDSVFPNCHNCGVFFSFSNRRHHCRNCGYVFCTECSKYRSVILMRQVYEPVRVCLECFRTLSVSGVSAGGGPASDVNRSTDPCVSGESQDWQRSHSLLQEGTDRNFGSPSTRRVQSAGHLDREGNYFVGAGGFHSSGNPPGADTVEYSNSGHGPSGFSANGIYNIAGNSETVADQLQKNRLLQCWPEVRQRAVFTDVLLQQVKRITVNSVVEFSRETEGIVLQPELPVDQLHTVFPFPPAAEANAQLLVEPVDLRTPAYNLETVESVIHLVEQQLLLPPALTIPNCESLLLRQY